MKWHIYKIIHGGIVDNSKTSGAVQASSSGEQAEAVQRWGTFQYVPKNEETAEY